MHFPLLPPMPFPPPPPGTGVMIPPPMHMYNQIPPPPNAFVPPVPATANMPLYYGTKKNEPTEIRAQHHDVKDDNGASMGPRRPTAADIEQSRGRLVELPEHAYESASEDDEKSRSDAELMPPPPRVVPGTVSPAKRKRRNSLTHTTDEKFPAPKRQKTSSEHSDEDSSEDEGASGFKLVNYDENEDEDKFTAPRNKIPFWAAPSPGKPIFSVLGHNDEQKQEEDVDQAPDLSSSNGMRGKALAFLFTSVNGISLTGSRNALLLDAK